MKQKMIINVYVPFNTILTCNYKWNQSLNLPKINADDLRIINELRKSAELPCIGGDMNNSRQILLDSNICIRKVKSLSFYQYLLDRLLQQARDAAGLGVRHFLIQNSNAPYFNKKQPVIYWIMRCLVRELKLICTDEFSIGLKLNDNLDNWALDIAARNGLDYIICNNNIADLYLQRKLFNDNVKIYSNFDEKVLSINQEGFIFEDLKDKDNAIGCRNYLKQLPFYPKDIEAPVIYSVWDLMSLPKDLSQVDFIMFNYCFSKNEYCDCGLDKQALNQFIDLSLSL